MSLSPYQLRRFVVRPALEHLGLRSPAAENLVLGTAAHESGGFKFIDQVTSSEAADPLGPAIGLWQIEPATHDDLWRNFLAYRDPLAKKVLALIAPEPERHVQLATNLIYGAAVCRLIYYRAPQALPAAEDLASLAEYWKRFYNTPAGKGTIQQFVDDYKRYVR